MMPMQNSLAQRFGIRPQATARPMPQGVMPGQMPVQLPVRPPMQAQPVMQAPAMAQGQPVMPQNNLRRMMMAQ
jgi:hypothetical protein